MLTVFALALVRPHRARWARVLLVLASVAQIVLAWTWSFDSARYADWLHTVL
jgi:hypothetical protein